MQILKPSRYIGGELDPYLIRWHLLPRNPIFNIYLHKMLRDDDDRALHDHPWPSVSFLLKGQLREIISNAERYPKRFVPFFRSATLAHRLELVFKDEPVWTLFITGPKIRSWGFLCPQGWVHWRQFTDETGDRVGRGCGET